MTNMLIQPLWLTHFIEILLVPEFQLTKFIFGMFSYKAYFRSQISSNEKVVLTSIWYIFRFITAAKASTNLMEVYLATGAKVSS